MPQHMSKKMSKKCRNFRHKPSHPCQLFILAFFSTLKCRKTQFLMAFFRHNTVENLSKNLSKSTPIFSSARWAKQTSIYELHGSYLLQSKNLFRELLLVDTLGSQTTHKWES
jgi:hypothetical protein